QRPITEVMWATIPFLLTMIVALLTITYVPGLTIVPEPERTGTIASLVEKIHSGVEESRAVKEITLVDAAGNVLKMGKGLPIVPQLPECSAISDELKRDSCRAPFEDLRKCSAEPDPKACANKKIADWVVSYLNGGVDVATAIITIDEVPLVN